MLTTPKLIFPKNKCQPYEQEHESLLKTISMLTTTKSIIAKNKHHYWKMQINDWKKNFNADNIQMNYSNNKCQPYKQASYSLLNWGLIETFGSDGSLKETSKVLNSSGCHKVSSLQSFNCKVSKVSNSTSHLRSHLKVSNKQPLWWVWKVWKVLSFKHFK